VLDNRPSLVEALYDPIPRTLVIGPFPG
jgi:hypothetical protein